MSETPLIGPHSKRSVRLLPQKLSKQWWVCTVEMERAHALSHDLETQQRKRSWNNEEKNKHCVKITAPNDTVQPLVMNVKQDPLGTYIEMMAKRFKVQFYFKWSQDLSGLIHRRSLDLHLCLGCALISSAPSSWRSTLTDMPNGSKNTREDEWRMFLSSSEGNQQPNLVDEGPIRVRVCVCECVCCWLYRQRSLQLGLCLSCQEKPKEHGMITFTHQPIKLRTTWADEQTQTVKPVCLQWVSKKKKIQWGNFSFYFISTVAHKTILLIEKKIIIIRFLRHNIKIGNHKYMFTLNLPINVETT